MQDGGIPLHTHNINTFIFIYLHTYIHTYLYIYIHTYIHTNIFIYIHTGWRDTDHNDNLERLKTVLTRVKADVIALQV